jgi:hypothetical protein
MRKIGMLWMSLSVALVFGMISVVSGQDNEDEMIVPMGIIVIEPPESVEAVRSAVEFPHSRHFISLDCKSCHHTWEGPEKIKTCTTSECHEITVSPTKSAKGKIDPNIAILYYKTAYHQMCIGCHKEIKIQNKKLEASFKELKETLRLYLVPSKRIDPGSVQPLVP